MKNIIYLCALILLLAWPAHGQNSLAEKDALAIDLIIKNNFSPQTGLGWKMGAPTTWDKGLKLNASQQITELKLSNNALTGVLGLQNLEALSTADFSHNKLSGLVLVNCPNLHTLSLGGNKIIEVEALGGLNSLGSLDLHNNALSDLTLLASLTSLKSLDLSRNYISQAAGLAALTQLGELNLSNNQLSDISALAKLALNKIDVGGNRLSLSQLAPFAQIKERNFGQQRHAHWQELVGRPGFVVDLSAEKSLNGVNTHYAVLGPDGQELTHGFAQRAPGVFEFTKPGNYVIRMTNPSLVSMGDFVEADNDSGQDNGEPTQVGGRSAVVVSGLIRIH